MSNSGHRLRRKIKQDQVTKSEGGGYFLKLVKEASSRQWGWGRDLNETWKQLFPGEGRSSTQDPLESEKEGVT